MENLGSKSDKELNTADYSKEKVENRTIPIPEQNKESEEKDKLEDLSNSIETESKKSLPAENQFTQIPKPSLEKEEIKSTAAEVILQKSYGHFSHQRLVESMGLNQSEADEFVLELIHQLENALPELDRKVQERDFEEIEHITHGLKGAALNIGSGGVADILVDYNQEMKESKSAEAAEAYQELLRRAISDLKIEYSQVA
ncbi:MAG: Hpt domain-containing protein [Hydrogenimonas sp.]|nr:Hpt domain-containing protein [Hydrogenimonas sp.]